MIYKYSQSEFSKISNIDSFFTNEKIHQFLNDKHEITTISSFLKTQVYVLTVPIVLKDQIQTRHLVVLLNSESQSCFVIYDDHLKNHNLILKLEDSSNYAVIISIFKLLVKEYYSVLDYIDIKVSILEANIINNLTPEIIVGIINFQKKIQNMSINLDALVELNNFTLNHNSITDQSLIFNLEELSIELKQLNAMCFSTNSLLDNISEGVDAINNYRLNKIMKTLTIATLMLSIPTMIAGVYGMNIPLPFQGEKNAFLAISIISIITLISIYFVLRKRKYW